MNDFETPTGIILTKRLKQLLDHVQLVAALREREACAKLCEDSVEYAGGELARQIRELPQTDT